MTLWYRETLLLLGLMSCAALAEPDSFGLGSARDGILTVERSDTVINRYAQVLGPVAPGDSVVLIEDVKGFAAGDLVMVLQVTGQVPESSPGSPAPIDLTNDAVGRWEFARLARGDAGLLSLTAPLVNSYAAQVTQVIRVPEYTQVDILRGASLRADPWNGRVGGVVALLVTGALYNEGSISATGAGFRGGAYVPASIGSMDCLGSVSAKPAGMAGEGIAFTQFGRRDVGNGHVGNGGGGGACPGMSGGGGGHRLPGAPGTGSGGVDGNSQAWHARGGSTLVYTLGERLVFGGGGGSGQGEDWSALGGGAGGGIVFIRTAALVGSGVMAAEGAPGGDTVVGGAGGGGAGGGLYLNVRDSAECAGLFARGGKGGTQGGGYPRGDGAGGNGGEGYVVAIGGGVERCPSLIVTGRSSAAPTVTIDNVRTGGWVQANPTIKLEGRATAGSVVLIQVNGSSVLDAIAVMDSGSWQADVPHPQADDKGFFEEEEQYTLKVTAEKDGTSSAPSEVQVGIDNTPPSVSFSRKPGNRTKDRRAEFGFSANDKRPRVVLKCGLATAEYGDCKTNTSHEILVDEGIHAFRVHATDLAGNVKVESYQWQVDLTPPQVGLTTKPNEFSNSREANFTFSFDADDVEKVRCARDSPSGLGSCDKDNGKGYSSLAEGSHTFYVEAEDDVGNVSTRVSYAWTVDVTPPHIGIEDKPKELDNSRTARFTFSSHTVSDVKEVQCALSSGATPREEDFSRCSGALEDEFDVTEGAYTFFVRAKDAAGNISALDKYSWTVDHTSPTVRFDKTPNSLEKSKTAVFKLFSIALDWAGFECSLNDEAFEPCPSSIAVSAKEGLNKFSVRAVDKAGNKELSETHNWTVDTIPPFVEISEPKPGAINTKLPYVVGTTDKFSEVLVLVDSVPKQLVQADKFGRWFLILETELTEDEHIITAEATDPAGNPCNELASVTFTVDVIAPVTKFVMVPDKVHRSRTAKFVFSSNEEVDFQCQLDSADFIPCEAKRDIEGLSNGVHTFSVKARDRAGNVESSPASYRWTVHVDAPLYPDIAEPVDGAEVNTGTPIISGTAVENGSVIIFIDGVPSEPIPVDPSRNWTFRPTVRLAEGRHSLSGKSVDMSGQDSETRSPEVYFRVSLAKETGLLTGGACSAHGLGAGSLGNWLLLAVWGLFGRRRS